MVLTLDELIKMLEPLARPNDTLPSEALRIRFAGHPKITTKYDATCQTVDYRTPDDNTLVPVDIDNQGAILAIERFP
jgi:hypothetical protein